MGSKRSPADPIGQFFSPRTNRRTVEFGGSTENRACFALMVHEKIRRRVGDDTVVGIRFVVDEGIEDGIDFEECLKIAGILERSGLIDFLQLLFRPHGHRAGASRAQRARNVPADCAFLEARSTGPNRTWHSNCDLSAL
jgi:2,4-dienoyl-CoA reductase-like NADH-dependent reductase (Old Yellow Enzyme family)